MGIRSKCVESAPGSFPLRVVPFCRSAPRLRGTAIVDLRNLLAERFPQPITTPVAHLVTGLPEFDQAIGGGLRKGAITELVSPNISAGSALLICALLDAAHHAGYFLALVDGRDSFDPAPVGNARLSNLLWIRCAKAAEAIKAADLLLRDGNFSLVILDLILNAADELRRIPQTNWYRLQRLLEPAPTVFLVLTRHSVISSAQCKVVLENKWSITDLEQDHNAARFHVRVERVHGGRQRITGTG